MRRAHIIYDLCGLYYAIMIYFNCDDRKMFFFSLFRYFFRTWSRSFWPFDSKNWVLYEFEMILFVVCARTMTHRSTTMTAVKKLRRMNFDECATKYYLSIRHFGKYSKLFLRRNQTRCVIAAIIMVAVWKSNFMYLYALKVWNF